MCALFNTKCTLTLIQSRNIITCLSPIQALSQDHVIELFSQRIHIFNIRPLSQSKQEELFHDDLCLVDTLMMYYEDIEGFEVFSSLSLLPEMVFPLILSFLVKDDPPDRFVPVGLQLKWRKPFFEWVWLLILKRVVTILDKSSKISTPLPFWQDHRVLIFVL